MLGYELQVLDNQEHFLLNDVKKLKRFNSLNARFCFENKHHFQLMYKYNISIQYNV